MVVTRSDLRAPQPRTPIYQVLPTKASAYSSGTDGFSMHPECVTGSVGGSFECISLVLMDKMAILDCDSRPARNVCNFRPRLDDMQNVTCVATYRDPSKSFQANYTLNLLYPPESSAAISIEPPQTEPLTQGDVITCTVSGGKPRVTNVTFHCQHPDHADREDDVSDDGRTVSSSITVDTSQATEVNMTCTCSAHWDPKPELYDNITNAEFMLEYKSIVKNFTVNSNTSKTVAESEMVMFRCQGAGRPSPTLILRKRGYGTAITDGSDSEKGLLHSIGSARCKDLGNYTCEANNKFFPPNSKTVQLFVKCK
ncbi:uncharacterized protein [Littorina saxatilis]|uniref:uncharacterized protein n=1 Tax=Littorina saxatilis TaxID=31220 RepID=UPI0038B5BFF9